MCAGARTAVLDYGPERSCFRLKGQERGRWQEKEVGCFLPASLHVGQGCVLHLQPQPGRCPPITGAALSVLQQHSLGQGCRLPPVAGPVPHLLHRVPSLPYPWFGAAEGALGFLHQSRKSQF